MQNGSQKILVMLQYIFAMALIIPWLHFPTVFISRDAFVNFTLGYGLFTFLIIYGGRWSMMFGAIFVLHRTFDFSALIILDTYYPGIAGAMLRIILNDGGQGASEFFFMMLPKISLAIIVGLSYVALYYWLCKNILKHQKNSPRRPIYIRVFKVTIITGLLTLGYVRKSDMEVFLWDTKFSQYQDYLLAKKSQPISNLVSNKIDIYIAIGESASRNHLSLYGYKRKTTPFLDTLHKQGKLVKYDGYSPAGTTGKSFTAMFSKSPIPSMKRFFTTPTLIEELKHMGYNTLWATYDEIHPDGEDGYILNALGRQSDIFIASNTLENDLETISLVERHLQDRATAYFIHTYGSHIDYDRRVPEHYKKFSITKGKKTHKKAIIDSYDDTLLHLDRLHEQLYGVAERHKNKSNRPYAIVYVSDHGQVMFADGSDWQSHSISPNQTAGFEVPFFVVNKTVLPCDGLPSQKSVVNTGKLYDWVITSLCGFKPQL